MRLTKLLFVTLAAFPSLLNAADTNVARADVDPLQVVVDFTERVSAWYSDSLLIGDAVGAASCAAVATRIGTPHEVDYFTAIASTKILNEHEAGDDAMMDELVARAVADQLIQRRFGFIAALKDSNAEIDEDKLFKELRDRFACYDLLAKQPF